MTQLSKERLEEIRDYDTCVTLEESAEMARLLLVVEGQEPVVYIGNQMLESLCDEGGRSCGRVWRSNTDEMSGESRIPLYAAPQPAPVAQTVQVPDKSGMAAAHIAWMDKHFPRKTFSDEEWEEVSLYTWLAWREACRAAPPAPVAQPVQVPDELTREDYKRRFMEEDDFDNTFRGGWNACRAAMLKGDKS